MKNFGGRILILIATLVGIFSLFADLGITIFYIWTKFDVVVAELSAPNAVVDYVGLITHLVSIAYFIIVLVLCMKDIIIARSMKTRIYYLIPCLLLIIFAYLFNILVPGIVLFDSVTFLTTIFIIKSVIVSILIVGSFLNFKKDCRL